VLILQEKRYFKHLHTSRGGLHGSVAGFQPQYDPGVDTACNRNEYQESSYGYRAACA
jgi:hypothetical protein